MATTSAIEKASIKYRFVALGVIFGCHEALSHHLRGSRFISIKPKTAKKPFLVLCDVKADRAYTVISRRRSSHFNLNADREMYYTGLGAFKSNFWLGFRQILPVIAGNVSLEIEILCDIGNSGNFSHEGVQYGNFSIAGEDEDYRLLLNGFMALSENGNLIGNALAAADGQSFSTYDNDFSTGNCSVVSESGWWFGDDCWIGNLNAKYQRNENDTQALIRWPTAGGLIRIKETELKIWI